MRDYDLTKAKNMYLNYLKWREEFHVDALSEVSSIHACISKPVLLVDLYRVLLIKLVNTQILLVQTLILKNLWFGEFPTFI